MFAPGVPNLMAEFRSTNIELGTFVVSIYVLGFASGPMVLAPLSELYGRMPIVSVESSQLKQHSLTKIVSCLQFNVRDLQCRMRSLFKSQHAHRLPITCWHIR